MASGRKKDCQAYRNFKTGKFIFCMHCIHFFKSGSICSCTGHFRKRDYHIPHQEMIFAPIAGALKFGVRERIKK